MTDRPFVFVLGAGGSTRLPGSARGAILWHIIGWNFEQIMAHRDTPLDLRITHQSEIRSPIYLATWDNVLSILKEKITDEQLLSDIEEVKGQLPLYTFEEAIAQGGLLATVRQKLRQFGISSRFKGTGRLDYCNEYAVDPKDFFGAPGVDIQF